MLLSIFAIFLHLFYPFKSQVQSEVKIDFYYKNESCSVKLKNDTEIKHINCFKYCKKTSCKSLRFNSNSLTCDLFYKRATSSFFANLETTQDLIFNYIFEIYSLFNEECNTKIDNCDRSIGLSCQNKTCQCKNSTLYWSDNKKICTSCMKDWNMYNQTWCYKTFTESITWDQSNSECMKYNSSLLILKEEEKFNYFKNLAKGVGNIWLNLKTDKPRIFKWPDASPVNRNYWNSGEPNNCDPSIITLCEPCADLTQQGGFNDISCSYTYKYICEYIL